MNLLISCIQLPYRGGTNLKILSITTSSPICGVAILEDNNLIKEINLNNGLTHSETLMPIIKQILDETNLNLNDIDLLSVDVGPGSFTGIRIGVSTVKAFVDSLGLNAVGISSLEALSLNAKSSGVICSLVDAKKGNVYNEIFEFTSGQALPRRNASFDNINDLLEELKNINPEYDITFVGNGALTNKDVILESLPNSKFIENNDLSAVNIGLYGLARFQSGNLPSIEPLYLRKTDAEQKLGNG